MHFKLITVNLPVYTMLTPLNSVHTRKLVINYMNICVQGKYKKIERELNTRDVITLSVHRCREYSTTAQSSHACYCLAFAKFFFINSRSGSLLIAPECVATILPSTNSAKSGRP